MIQKILTHKMPPWLICGGPENDVAVSTRVRIARNLAHHQFPQRASLFERAKVFEETAAAFKAAAGCGSFNAVSFCQLDKQQQQFLVEERLASPELAQADGERGLIHDEARRVCIMVNEEDHIRLQAIDSGFRPQELWPVLDAVDDSVGTRLDYAFDGCKGFLTCCPTNAGTGLRISVLLHLPGLVLTRSIDPVLHGASQMGVATRGFSGEQTSVVGNFFQLSNSAAMGASETGFIDSTSTVVKNIIDFERKARERILADARSELTDKIFRSWGILCQATLLGIDEFLNLSSALRTGIECNLFDKCTIDDLNRLTLFVLPAHLQTCCGTTMSDSECKAARADLVKGFLGRQDKKLTVDG
jgi:protein arginine kinase